MEEIIGSQNFLRLKGLDSISFTFCTRWVMARRWPLNLRTRSKLRVLIEDASSSSTGYISISNSFT